ncbi:hypothetical protein BS47DRAFT_1335622 [Hydnum rufescens UP504]|uniref:Uncharacterized protein n=1 Tax=Hydnum rufescens UP504 TaxID=1448309 RepID=A0A9P6B9X2_9AGAM|nr:hypothetical protein BS47DRAFT_1335622 [Hydnum rufescens UP504]
MAKRNEVRKIVIRRRPLTNEPRLNSETRERYVPLEVRAWKWVLADGRIDAS